MVQLGLWCKMLLSVFILLLKWIDVLQLRLKTLKRLCKEKRFLFMTGHLPGLHLKSENFTPAYHFTFIFHMLHICLMPCCFCLQVGERCSLGWSSFGTLFGWVCHCLWLPVWVLEQGPAGAFPPGDRKRVTPDVREVVRPRLGVPVPAQPPAHQLCGSADRQPGLHDPRLVAGMLFSMSVQSKVVIQFGEDIHSHQRMIPRVFRYP